MAFTDAERADSAPSQDFGYLDGRPALVPLLAVAVVAFIGIADHPYEYYLFLRGVVTGAAVLVIVYSIYCRQLPWLVLAAFMVLIWAPAGWFQFQQSTWRLLDLLLAVALAVAGSVMKYTPGNGFNQVSWWKIALFGLIPIFVMVAGAFAPSDYAGVPCDESPYGC